MHDSISESADQACQEEDKPDLAGYLTEKKRLLRDQFTIRPLTAEESQVAADMSWAVGDPDVQSKYQGEFVVPWHRTIVAHGHDATEVLAEAASVTGQNVKDLPLVGIVDPLLDIPH